MVNVNWNPTRRELRQFGILCTGVFGILGAYPWWKGGITPGAACSLIAAGLGALGCWAPSILRPVYIVWMTLAFPIGWAISHLLLLGVFYLVLTPIGFLLRLFRYDPLNRRFDRSAPTYWTPHEAGAGAERYFKQF
jgi:hypothetical protein